MEISSDCQDKNHINNTHNILLVLDLTSILVHSVNPPHWSVSAYFWGTPVATLTVNDREAKQMLCSVEVWQWKTWRMFSYLSKFSSENFILIRTSLSCCNARVKSLTKSSSSFVCPTFGMLKSSVLPVKFLC